MGTAGTLKRALVGRSTRAQLYVVGVTGLTAFLAYSSQFLLRQLLSSEELVPPDSLWSSSPSTPATSATPPPSVPQLVVFNLLVLCIWICYWRTCVTAPGRIPRNWHVAAASGIEHAVVESGSRGSAHMMISNSNDGSVLHNDACSNGDAMESASLSSGDGSKDMLSSDSSSLSPSPLSAPPSIPSPSLSPSPAGQRWCSKCEMFKPPRAHHCKQCRRCIPKMDHHCPWTANCVSHHTLPHFVRFLTYAVAAMGYLEYFLYCHAAVIWANRDLPSYMGPSLVQIGHLFVLIMANSFTLFAVGVLLVRTIWSLAVNTTTIEGWEIDRHRALLRRARILGGYVYGPDGIKVPMKKQEFPYDIGIWRNFKQGMGGSGNILGWFWPFAATPSVESGLAFEVNGFEDESLPWPPADPERMHRRARQPTAQSGAFMFGESHLAPQEQLAAFRRRQQQDMRRWGVARREDATVVSPDYRDDGAISLAHPPAGHIAEGPWRNREGERLDDFGVDEETEI